MLGSINKRWYWSCTFLGEQIDDEDTESLVSASETADNMMGRKVIFSILSKKVKMFIFYSPKIPLELLGKFKVELWEKVHFITFWVLN